MRRRSFRSPATGLHPASAPGRCHRALWLALALLAGTWAVAPAAAVTYDDYHDFGEVEARLQEWAGRAEVDLIDAGRSAGGRTLWVAQIAGAGPVDPDERPAVFVGANIAGFHNAGTEAALHLVETLLEGGHDELLAQRTFYVAPVLNPDAHDALFAPVRAKRSGNAMTLDHDRDGFEAEDGFDDLDGDGRVTKMRIPDPAGQWLPHPEDPRVMIRADSMKGRAGAYRVVSEGRDDDGDGEHNEDPAFGVAPDRSFAHQFPYPDPDAGPWPGYAPETKAVMDFLLARRNVALAIVYGPANNLLEKPRSLGGGGDLGTQKFKVPEQIAEFIGLDPEKEYTIDEVWEVVKDLPFVVQNNITKDQIAQFLGAGPATQVADEDMAWLDRFADDYEERLEEAGLSKDRPAEQYGKGGFTPWLYYQYGVMALELDVWGVPEPEKEESAEEAEAPLTVDRLEGMSADEVIALGQEELQAFLDENGVPAQYNAEMVVGALESGQITPERMAGMIRQMGGGGGGESGGSGDSDDDAQTKRAREVLAWIDEHAPDAASGWTAVTLPDGTEAEVGGIDPFIETAPPSAILEPALGAHTETVLALAGDLARVEVLSVEAVPVSGDGVVRVRAVAGNRGTLPTHTKLDERMRTHLPVRLELVTGDGVELITGQPGVTSERLEGSSGTLEGTWLVRAQPGAEITVRVRSDNAGTDEKSTTVRKGA